MDTRSLDYGPNEFRNNPSLVRGIDLLGSGLGEGSSATSVDQCSAAMSAGQRAV